MLANTLDGATAVALLAEGVDRNFIRKEDYGAAPKVALLAEGVDRNMALVLPKLQEYGSPSSRRAWIEITPGQRCSHQLQRRPPRGGRG